MKGILKDYLEQKHRGHQNAITARELADYMEIPERKVRLIIRELIADGVPIASSTENMKGYFIIETRAEADTYAQSLRNRLIEDALRRRDFRRAAAHQLREAEQGVLI